MKFNNVNGVVPEDNPQLDPTRPNALVVDDIGIQFNLNPDKVDNFKEFFIKGIKNAFRKKTKKQFPPFNLKKQGICKQKSHKKLLFL